MVLLQSAVLSIGEFKAPEFTLPATDGQQYTLANFLPCKGVVITFTCNHCPYAQAAWPLLIGLHQEYKLKGIEFIAINPNDEFSYPDDSFQAMKQRVKKWGISFPYLHDGSQAVAQAYQAVCTPDIYVFDARLILYYHGRINDRWQDQRKVTRNDLRHALNSLIAGQPPPSNQVPSMGCSIKWLK